MSNREQALAFVRALVGRGYTSERAKEEIHMGYGAAYGGPSYEISRGKIKVPMFPPNETFLFADLEDEIRYGAVQPTLF